NRLLDLQERLAIPVPYLENLDRSEATQIRESIADAERTLNDATSRMQTAQRTLDEAKAALAEFEKNPSAPVYSFNVESAVSSDPAVAALRASVAQAETEIDLKKQTFKENNPQLQVLKQTLDSLKARLAGVEQQARRDALNS